jgi:hypothetical protein
MFINDFFCILLWRTNTPITENLRKLSAVYYCLRFGIKFGRDGVQINVTVSWIPPNTFVNYSNIFFLRIILYNSWDDVPNVVMYVQITLFYLKLWTSFIFRGRRTHMRNVFFFLILTAVIKRNGYTFTLDLWPFCREVCNKIQRLDILNRV